MNDDEIPVVRFAASHPEGFTFGDMVQGLPGIDISDLRSLLWDLNAKGVLIKVAVLQGDKWTNRYFMGSAEAADLSFSAVGPFHYMGVPDADYGGKAYIGPRSRYETKEAFLKLLWDVEEFYVFDVSMDVEEGFCGRGPFTIGDETCTGYHCTRTPAPGFTPVWIAREDLGSYGSPEVRPCRVCGGADGRFGCGKPGCYWVDDGLCSCCVDEDATFRGHALGTVVIRKCRVCGCTDDRGCGTPDGGTCHWVEWDLCSHCAQEGPL